MKKCVLATLWAFAATSCFAQQDPTPEVTNVTKATFLNPGISYEKALGQRQTFYAQAFLNTSAYFSFSSALGTSAGVRFDPALTAQYRYYYNLAKRQEAGKRSELNSGNYLSPVIEVTLSRDQYLDEFAVPKQRGIYTVGGVWGIQRNYHKRFSLDFNVGLGYYFTNRTYIDNDNRSEYVTNHSDFTTMGQLNLGFWLNKRSKSQ